MKYQAIFFDFDGTLFDTRRDITAAYLTTFAELGFPIQESTFRIGPPMAECIRQAKPDISNELFAATAAKFKEKYDTNGFPGTVPYPGVNDLLEKLSDAGVAIYVATNKRMLPLTLILRKFGWEKRFAGLYGSDLLPERNLSKIAMLKLALSEHNLTGGSCLMVGDTAGDIIAGRAAGMDTAGAEWGYGSTAELTEAEPNILTGTPADLWEKLGKCCLN